MNHAFITFRGRVSSDKVDAALREIVTAKWGDKMRVRRYEDQWEIKPPIEDWHAFGLTIWLESTRKVEMRRDMPGEAAGWLQCYLQNSLALKLNGLCGDEGIGDRWKGHPADYDTFEKYADVLIEHVTNPLHRLFLKKLRKDGIKRMPKEVRALLK